MLVAILLRLRLRLGTLLLRRLLTVGVAAADVAMLVEATAGVAGVIVMDNAASFPSIFFLFTVVLIFLFRLLLILGVLIVLQEAGVAGGVEVDEVGVGWMPSSFLLDNAG